jgi:hypothetical protein
VRDLSRNFCGRDVAPQFFRFLKLDGIQGILKPILIPLAINFLIETAEYIEEKKIVYSTANHAN